MNIRCPHCKSTKGYYTLNSFKDVPVLFSFDGTVKKIKADVNDSCRRKDAYCISCQKVIMTARELEMKIRGQRMDNPIQKYRKLAGYTQGQLSELLGCSRSTIAEWEKRNSAPRKKEHIAMMNKLFKHSGFIKEFCEFYGIE